MNSQPLGNGKNHLPMRDRTTDIFSDVNTHQQRTLLVAGWASASLFARIGNEHFVLAVLAAHSGKTFLEIPTLEKSCYRALDNRTPESVLALITLSVDLTEGVKMLVDQTPQFGYTRITWFIQYGQFGTRGNHEENAISGSQVGNRKAPSPSIPSIADRPMATAWKYTHFNMYIRTPIVHQRLLLTTHGCKPLGSLWIRNAFYFPESFPMVENLSAMHADWDRSVKHSQ
jgi:hypothetical protein